MSIYEYPTYEEQNTQIRPTAISVHENIYRDLHKLQLSDDYIKEKPKKGGGEVEWSART